MGVGEGVTRTAPRVSGTIRGVDSQVWATRPQSWRAQAALCNVEDPILMESANVPFRSDSFRNVESFPEAATTSGCRGSVKCGHVPLASDDQGYPGLAGIDALAYSP